MANTRIVTPEFRLHHVRQFIESITESSNTIYYVFAGKPNEFITGDTVVDSPNTDIEALTTRVYDEMVMAKRITSNDAKPLVKRYNWVTGTVYDMYDSLDKNLKDKAFYVVSQEGGFYYVFKCLFNKEGSTSISQPLFSSTSADDNYYETADGYIWKYMYKVDSTTFNKFATNEYIPVIPDANVSANAISGEIDIIKLNYGGRFYNNYLEGFFSSSDINFSGNPNFYRISSVQAKPLENYYKGCIVKITSGIAAGQYRKITNYYEFVGYWIIVIDSPFSFSNEDIVSGFSYEISPEVLITGDGRQTIEAAARALVNSTSSNSIYKIEVLNKGQDYFLASANVYIDSAARTPDIIGAYDPSVYNAQLRVIYSPKGGHGYDVESELFATSLGISVKFSNTEQGEISSENDFRTVGILKDPKFKDVKLTYATDTLKGNGFADGEEIIQAKINRISGAVAVSSTSKNIFSVGALTQLQITSSGNVKFTNSTSATGDTITISNAIINATCNVETNSTSYIIKSPIVSAGYGISDQSSLLISAANSTGGNVRYFNSTIITGLSAAANGRSYSNSDYIEVSSPSAVVNAIAILSTNSIGGILSATLVNSGKGFLYNEIDFVKINDGGLGYQNGSVTITGGGGTGATAIARTDVSGNVQSITFSNKGINYSSAPTIVPQFPGGAPTKVGSFVAYIKSKNSIVRFSNSSGGYSNGAKVARAYLSLNDELLTTDTASLDLDFMSSSYKILEGSSVSGDSGLYTNTDLMIFVSPSSTHGNAVANVMTYDDGSLRQINVNSGGNYGFNIGNTYLDFYVANSSGGNKRRFTNKIVGSVSITNNAPSYKLKYITIGTASACSGTNYNNTRLLRVDIADGGIGYDSTANNIIVFNGSGSAANAYYTNDSFGKIISVVMVANGTGYGNTVSFSGNTSGVSDADNFITVTHTLGNAQPVFYYSASSQPTIAGLTNNTIYYVKDANTTGIKLSLTPNGSVIDIGNTVINTTQFLRSITTVSINAQANGIGANLIPVLANSVVITANGTGVGAIGFFTNNPSGAIQNVIIANQGFGYVNPPLITAPHTTGGTLAVLTGFVEGVTAGFTNGDVITFYGGTANGTANIIANGFVSNIHNLYYTGRSYFLGTRETFPTGIWFKPDGTRLYSIGSTADMISQYDLSTAWDVTTSSHAGNSVSGVLRQGTPTDMFMTANGTSLYISSGTGSPTNANGVLQFSLSQAWNVQTMSYVANVVTQSRESAPSGLHFKTDGSRMYVIGSGADKIVQYDLSTPWDVTTATYSANVDPYISANAGYGSALRTSQAIRFNDNGTQVFVVDSFQSKLLSMPLTQAWNIESTVTSSVANLSLDFIDQGPTGLYANVSLGKLWIAGATQTDSIYEFQAQPVYTATLTDSGAGFTSSNLRIKVANSTGGNTRYLNANIIQDIVVSSGGFSNFGVNTDVIYVTNGNINAVGNAVTNSTGGLAAVNLTVSGAGFVNVSSLNMYTVNSIGGDLRYFNTNVVSSIGINDGGFGYTNTDYVIITSPNGIAALANIETNSSGSIVSTKLSNRGKGIIPWSVANVDILNGGLGYSNSDVIQFCGGGGTGANAILLTNSSGGIVRAYIVNGGQNYDCAPGVEVANSTGGTPLGLGANLVAKLLKPTTIRVYNSNGNPSFGTFADLYIDVKPSPVLIANLVTSPTIGTLASPVSLSNTANIEVEIVESANVLFSSSTAPYANIIIDDTRSTFDSSISGGDKIYLQTNLESQILTVDEVANSTWLTVTELPAFTSTSASISVAKVNARGVVKERQLGSINVSNVYGFFVQSNDIIGETSRTYAKATGVFYNGVQKNATNVNQLFVYKIQPGSGITTDFTEDEVLRGGTNNQATAYFHSAANSTAINVVRPNGLFQSGNVITGETSKKQVTLEATNVYKYEGDFVRGSGDIIYIENIEPISRSNTQSETIKLVLEF